MCSFLQLLGPRIDLWWPRTEAGSSACPLSPLTVSSFWSSVSLCFRLVCKPFLLSEPRENKKGKLVNVKPYADILMFFEGATVSL